MSTFIYLASQSPRRAQLLTQIGVNHQLLLPPPEEDAEALEAQHTNELPADYVQRVTLAKLQAAKARLQKSGRPVAPILCADTTVALGKRIFGKPQDAAHARQILSQLSGKTHRVLTAVAISWNHQTAQALNTSHVQFAPLTPDQINRYIDTQEPFGKAGAYAIQSAAAAWIKHIQGSHSAIMGLPLFETAELLKKAHVLK